MQLRAALSELAILALCAGCQRPEGTAHRAPPAASALSRVAAPKPAGTFACNAGTCVQPYPRLPDTGEWRCADQGFVVWCAGGEPAAGVIAGPPDPSYRCGPRFGLASAARVCVDEHPDYPPDGAEHYSCAFAQERGISRVCKAGRPSGARALARGALPACWLDEDCRAGACDRGTCRCSKDEDCDRGSCKLGVCSEAS